MKKLLMIFAIILMFLSCKIHTKEIFYFNNDLEFFVIVYGVECGNKLEKNSKGEWEYYIPEDGFLLLQNERERGGIDNMEAYMKVDGKYQLHSKITPFGKDFGEPRGGTMTIGFSPRPNYVCGNMNGDLTFVVYGYIVGNNDEEINEKIDSFIYNKLFGAK
jgi:hypothetical protein